MKSRWQPGRTQPNHADDWLMTYADMITLLLCFFAIIIMVSVSKKSAHPLAPAPAATVEQPKIPQTVMPDILPDNVPFHPIEHIDDRTGNVADPLPIKETEYVVVPIVAPVDVPVPALPFIAALSKNELKPQDSANVLQKGDRITVLEMNSAAFFDSGSAITTDAGKAILLGVAQNLKSEQFKDYRITVEGHTDDTPIHTALFPSNWELSTARASAVVHFFLDQGVPASRLRAAGYADTFPKVPNKDSSGHSIPANRAENRRVVINLERIEKN